VIVAAVAGMLLGVAHLHFVWDALRNPDRLVAAKLEVNPWALYTQQIYVVRVRDVRRPAAYLYVDRREARA
jgi:hypothetical protein